MYLLSYKLLVDDELTPVGVYSTDRLAKEAFWALRRDLLKADESAVYDAVIEQFLLDKPPAGRYEPRARRSAFYRRARRAGHTTNAGVTGAQLEQPKAPHQSS